MINNDMELHVHVITCNYTHIFRGGTEVIKVIQHKSMTCVIANTILFNTYTYSMKNYYFCCGFPLAWATRYNNAHAQWSTSGLPHLLKEVGGVERSSQRQKVVRRCAELLEVLRHLPDQPDRLCRPCIIPSRQTMNMYSDIYMICYISVVKRAL